MRIEAKQILAMVMLGLILIGCEAPKGSKGQQETGTEQTEPSPEPAAVSSENPEADPSAEAISAVLNANLASEEDLAASGLPADLVAQILEQRPFISMDEFNALLGSDADNAEIYKKVFIPFNLNTTAEEDFQMIPGVGDRMAHEFEEYRPYTSIQQFRREISKYVDDKEVARYEHYVFVPVELNSASEADIKALPGVGDRIAHEFEEYRPYSNMAQFRKEIGKYVDDKELARLERFVYLQEK